MGILATKSKNKRPARISRLRAAMNLIAAYIKLDEGSKECFEWFLVQVYEANGMEPYVNCMDGRVLQRANYPHIREDMYGPWSAWAEKIQNAPLNVLEQRQAVREMLGALIRQKDRVHLTDFELVNAAKGALHWEKSAAKQSAWGRSWGFKSFSECQKWHQEELVRVRLERDQHAVQSGGRKSR